MKRITEGQCARMRELLRAGKALETLRDGPMVWQWAQQACEALEELLDQAEQETHADGGSLARRLRQSLEEGILRELRGRAALTDETKLESLSVHLLADGVIVDARLRLGRWRQ